jgi:hypothetical protein
MGFWLKINWHSCSSLWGDCSSSGSHRGGSEPWPVVASLGLLVGFWIDTPSTRDSWSFELGGILVLI